MVKNQLANTGDLDLTSGWGRSPGGGNGNSLQYSCPGKSHGQRSLAGYSPQGRKELDTTERLARAGEAHMVMELRWPSSNSQL